MALSITYIMLSREELTIPIIPAKGIDGLGAVAASCFKTINTECIDLHEFCNRQPAWCVIFDYIERPYNSEPHPNYNKGLNGPAGVRGKTKLFNYSALRRRCRLLL